VGYDRPHPAGRHLRPHLTPPGQRRRPAQPAAGGKHCDIEALRRSSSTSCINHSASIRQVRPEEDTAVLPRRDATDQPRCYGAAAGFTRPCGVELHAGLQGLTRRYGDLVALDDLSFTVAEDQTFGFVGPNGAGKTTAMRIILGVLEPNAGEVRWRGRPMNDEIRRRLGYLPEDHGQTFLNSAQALAPVQAIHKQSGENERDIGAPARDHLEAPVPGLHDRWVTRRAVGG
jgi:ABC-type glutathione transport system ATPase component